MHKREKIVVIICLLAIIASVTVIIVTLKTHKKTGENPGEVAVSAQTEVLSQDNKSKNESTDEADSLAGQNNKAIDEDNETEKESESSVKNGKEKNTKDITGKNTETTVEIKSETTSETTTEESKQQRDSLSYLYGYDSFSRFDINRIAKDYGALDSENPETSANYVEFRYDITDTGSGYKVVGKVRTKIRISQDEYQEYLGRALGDHRMEQVTPEGEYDPNAYIPNKVVYEVNQAEKLVHSGIEYTITEYYMNDQGRGNCTLVDEFGNTCVVSNDLSPEVDGNGLYFNMWVSAEDATIIIPYGTACEQGFSRLIESGSDNGNLDFFEIFGFKLNKKGEVSEVIPFEEITKMGYNLDP
ncbi:MAG: hypothetical protein IKO61_05800 [Lachnospiraceae bacterium]|nr:hypothetical protein [Lachnospiraceae bacterium]